MERKLENIQYELNYNSRELFQRYDQGKELLEKYHKWHKTELKKEKLKDKTLKLCQKIVLKSMQEAEELQKLCNFKLSRVDFDKNLGLSDDGDRIVDDDSIEKEEKWMKHLDLEIDGDDSDIQLYNEYNTSINTTTAQYNKTKRLEKQNLMNEDVDNMDEYNSAWMITQMKYPTISGDIRNKILKKENARGGRRRGGENTLIPNQISISMTQHN